MCCKWKDVDVDVRLEILDFEIARESGSWSGERDVGHGLGLLLCWAIGGIENIELYGHV